MHGQFREGEATGDQVSTILKFFFSHWHEIVLGEVYPGSSTPAEHLGLYSKTLRIRNFQAP